MTVASLKTENIKIVLRKKILDGEFGLLSRIPSERELSQEYETSRVTINRVISHLIQEGYLYRKVPRGALYVKGKGSKAGRANSIAVILGKQVQQAEHNPFYHWVFVGVEEVAAKMGISVQVHQFRDSDGMETLPRGLTPGKIDGVVACGVSWTGEIVALLKKVGKPIVSVQRDGIPFGITSIIADDEGCVSEMIDHLLQLGHRRIVFMHSPLTQNNSRFRGYQFAFLRNNLSLDPSLDIEVASRDPEVGYHSIDRILNCPAKPTSVFCENDGLAVGLISACRSRNIRVPEDLSVIGFDDCGLARSVFPPIPLTTGRIPIDLMGRLAFEHLMALVDKNETEAGDVLPLKIMVPTEFIIRETTCAPQKNNRTHLSLFNDGR